MGISCELTRRRLTLGDRDSVTGWRAKEWTDKTVEGVIISRGARAITTEVGSYSVETADFYTCDGVEVGDELVTEDGTYYEVTSIMPHREGDSFLYRTCHIQSMPMHP